MSSIPQISRLNALLANKTGRDKLYKTLQYLLKLLLELAHLAQHENTWLPHLKRFSLRISQSRALFRLGAWLADIERMEKILKLESPGWKQTEKLLTCSTVLISDWFDSMSCVYGIIRKDTSTSVHYCALFWLLGIIGDLVRQSRALVGLAIVRRKLQASKRRQSSTDHNTSSVDSIPILAKDSSFLSVEGSEVTIDHVNSATKENTIGILKSMADAVTATAIIYPRTVGQYRIFVCSCGFFAGTVGLVQNWLAIKV